MFLLGMLFLFPLLSSLSYSFSFSFLSLPFFFFFFNNFVPVPRSSRRPSVLVSIPLYFLLFYNPTSPAIAFPFPFIAAQKPFFVPMLDVGMQKFPGRREDIEESWMEITKGRAVYINAGYGKGGESRPFSFRMWHRMGRRWSRMFNYTQEEANLPVSLWSRELLRNKLPA